MRILDRAVVKGYITNTEMSYLREGAIMSLEPSYVHLEESENDFTNELGWLAAIAFAVVLIIASLHYSVL